MINGSFQWSKCKETCAFYIRFFGLVNLKNNLLLSHTNDRSMLILC